MYEHKTLCLFQGMKMKKMKYMKMMAKLLQISPVEQKEPSQS